jgi:predicted metalloprotease with PDZ domain
VPDVGVVSKNIIMGPIDTNSDAYHQGICHGDLILSINNEEHFNALSTQSFKQVCEAALFRDGKLTLHLEHSEHRAEFHHDILHENVHKGLRAVFGGMCCSSGVNANAGAGDKYQMEKGKSLADLV